MESKLLGHFKWAKHISGIPWMRSVCCQSRINHQISVDKLRNPETYGIDHDMVTVTHIAKYSCNCGKTVINIEGYLADYKLNGCLMTEINPDKSR